MINSNSRPDNSHAIQNARLMDKAETLEHAKRRAATSFSRMAASFTGELASETVRDEQDVLRARVDLLNELMRSPDTRLCLEAEGRQPRVCVTYDRTRCEGELELGPMQSTMAWAVQGCEDTIQQLLSAADRGGHEPVVKGLLGLVQQSAPAKDVLHGLHRVLSLPPPERMLLKSVAAGTTGEPHTRVIEGLGEARAEDAVPALYRVAWGALDLDVLEGWQNPSTNAAIRLSILHTAHQAAREAQRTKAAAWSNVGYIQARIFHGEECHTLTLRPFWDSESCTVSHLQFKQSVFDDCGPERGLLNLAQDPSSIHPIPLGVILPLQAYVCLGAHRKSRLSEVQLNYVHAQGLLAHGFDTRHLPDASTLLDLPAGRMVPAKSTRVSAQKLDVLASSYHVADQVYTTITVVQYPPFGTQFEKNKKAEAKITETRPVARQSGPRKPFARRRLAVLDPGANEWNPAANDGLDPEARAYVPAATEVNMWNRGNRTVSGEDRKKYEYFTPRDDNIDSFKGEKTWTWEEPLRLGEHFFLDGMMGDPFVLNHRFILFEVDNGLRYENVQKKLNEIKSMLFRTHKNEWLPELCFYGNLAENDNLNADNETVYDVWKEEWQKFLRTNYLEVMRDKDDNGYPLAFWYVPNAGVWKVILSTPEERADLISYQRRQEEILEYWQSKGKLDTLDSKAGSSSAPKYLTRRAGPPADASRLPLPRQAPKTQEPAALAQLQTRIDVLETKLSRVKQEENTKHLLEQVLERLDTL